ncbi:acetyl-CoA carboxylase biotin carboxylase subunit [Staphylothermus hellenicus]|uniref:Carbamoyl-phosphate synthase L chain ATP-binding protein n=1 Tax=Staphylothermus hellenicus (strain DSM 12710 / JCM 10830 / BK20S6-10-b1 / P8) TaxID=591019 RepID=D7DCA2_STAHD|nr:biotin carboxylase N-terminal domain-containing protein [Staphylothermus hellenicus]ADI31799.1 Carbamoyl-phosphate synthase L chain ATP-binding protein [Staphylothermus hellenicus DSM 12710]
MTLRILIANRGEIAVRIARSVKELGFIPLGIYTAEDKNSLHRKYMAEDIEVPSYLDIDEIVDAAIELGSDAVHPGYGFLSENPLFSKRIIEKGFIFIGPPPEIMELAGDKVRAKEMAAKAGVPTLPWMVVDDPKEVLEFGKEHGFPVILKAAGGGGGMGIRIVKRKEDVERLFEQARKEAENAFKDQRLYVEPYIENPKHIEVQILGDGDNYVHLYERDCSLQRRHQKIVEEAPSPILNNSLRKTITGDAVKLASFIKYVNAGTVEMLFDMKTKKHYFMEINARLQVEHPVTEMITGIDIVKQQIIIATEGALSLKQRRIRMHGHSIEARINAENPITLMPSPGTIRTYNEPSGPGVRVDSGVTSGSYVSTEYNPLISKLIVWGTNRIEAIRRMKRALNEYIITGIQTNIPLLKAIINHPVFISGTHTTKFLEKHWKDIKENIKEKELLHIAILLALAAKGDSRIRSQLVSGSRFAAYMNGVEHTRVESIKRRAWLYWAMLKGRVSRKRGRRKKK